MRLDRNFTIDLCRGMLFILMMNTHALTIANVAREHWLFSGFWLPNGWATVVFVVLSGYGVGYIYSIRAVGYERTAAMRRRAMVILAVMLVSNAFFGVLRQFFSGEPQIVFTFQWWLGFFNYETAWTISGVLLPTGLVLLYGPIVLDLIKKAPWATLMALIAARIVLAVWAENLGGTVHGASWSIRFFLTEGFGGYPVLPFLVNGCIGIWLGVQGHGSASVWRLSIVVLLVVHLAVYLSSFLPEQSLLRTVIYAASAPSKFAVMFVLASFLAKLAPRFLTTPIALIGKFALASFVLHRVFLQAIGVGLEVLGLKMLPVELTFCLLFVGTFLATWGLGIVRTRVNRINVLLVRMGL